MTVGRVDLARAFDDMIANQDGVRFQRVAVQLVRNIWPELIASETGKDLGADARIPESLAADNIGRVLACSITPTYAKILADARKVLVNFPDLKVLIFVTPAAVSNQRAAGWAGQIKEQLGFELIIMSREDLISRLLDPANESARQFLLGLAGTSIPDFERLCAEIFSAAHDNVNAWVAHRRVDSHPSLDLRFATVGEDGKLDDRIDYHWITKLLFEGKRFLLEAPPGSGKTTTLVQIARFFIEKGAIPILVHLPEWANSDHAGLNDFVAHLGSFQIRSLTAGQVLQVIQQRPTVILLNGWNELSAANLELIEERIRAEERQLPQTGFLVATRGHRFKPPIQGLSRITILKLARAQRREYLVEALGPAGDALATEIDRDRALDDLTRTPFILNEVMKLNRDERPLPSTKMGVLAEVTSQFEQNPEHRNGLLRQPLNGMGSQYLSGLAEHMTRQGQTIVNEQTARTICSTIGRSLVEQGQIGNAADPAEILGALTDHHVLERTIQATDNLQFEHQQFQEFYAAHALEKALEAAATDHQRVTDYKRNYIDWPAWEQPLKMLAEKIGSNFETEQELTASKAKLLIEMTAEIDMFFAGTLARSCRAALPSNVKAALVDRLKRWYAIPDEAHQELALAAIYETGFPELAEVIVPLLTSPNQQTRLQTYRNAREFHTSILGDDWKAIVSAWAPDARREFISELTTNGGRTDIAEYFAIEDPDVEVRRSSIKFLGWMEDTEKLVRSINALPTAERASALLQLHTEEIPAEFLPEIRAADERLLASEKDHVRRVELILRGRALGIPDVVNALKEELDRGGSTGYTHLNNRTLTNALTLIKESDQEWVSTWLATRATENALSFRTWGELLTRLPDDVEQNLVASVSTTDLGHGSRDRISVLASVVTVPKMTEAFEIYANTKAQIQHVNPPYGDVRFAIVRQLEELFRETPAVVTVEALSSQFDQPLNEHTLHCVTSLMNGVGRWKGDDGRPLDLRPELPEELRQRFRLYLKNAVPFACGIEDLSGNLVANLSSTLSRIGDPEDLVELGQLVNADMVRWGGVLNARAAGRHVQPTGWSMWHIRSLLSLGAPDADQILIALLDNDHYRVDAAKGLLELAQIEQIAPRPFSEPRFNQILLAREGRGKARFEEFRRQLYSSAIQLCVERRLEELRGMERPGNHSRSLVELAGFLAQLDGVRSAKLVCDSVAVQSRWGNWHRVDALRQVLFSGGAVPFETAHAVLQEVIADVAPQGYYRDRQDKGSVTSLLCLLPFTDNPEQGVHAVREVLARGGIYGHELRGVISSLGHSQAPGALKLLTEISGPGNPSLGSVATEWIDAIGNIGGRDGAETLFAFIESAQDKDNALPPHEHHLFEQAANKLATLVQGDDELKSRILRLVNDPGTPQRDFMLIKSIAAMDSLDALLSTMNLAIEDRSHRWPYFVLEEAFQDICLIKRRAHPDDSSYTLEPKQALELRRRLMEMVVIGDKRSRNSFSLLGRIDVWRLEHGKPSGEPRHPYIDCGLQWPPLELFESTRH